MKSIIMLLLVVNFGYTANGQDMTATVRTSELLVVIVPQKDCPLKIEDAIGVRTRREQAGLTYKVRNSGIKTIKSYTISIWFSDNGDGGVITTGVMPTKGKAFEPNTSVSNLFDSSKETPDESRSGYYDKEKKARLIAFVTIAEIVFADGSKYSSPETLESLKTHISKIESLYYEN